MKHLSLALMALILLVQGNLAYAESSLGTPLIAKETGGGFVPPDLQGWGKKLSIYSNGKVIESSRENYQSPWNHQLLAVLSRDVVTEIASIVATLEPGEIIFPDEPECTDLPTTTYTAKNGQGNLVQFAQNMACRFGTLENFYEAHHLKAILEGLDALSFER